MIMGDRARGNPPRSGPWPIFSRDRRGGGRPLQTAPPTTRSAERRGALPGGARRAAADRKAQVPMVDLPLGATETASAAPSTSKALSEGVRAFDPACWPRPTAACSTWMSVNLLDDHLVDVLLDSAASGWNTVEREGVSVRHPARFVLIGSGNPERRAAPAAARPLRHEREVRTVRDPELRVQVVDQRTAFDNDPDASNSAVQATQDALQARVVEPRTASPGDDRTTTCGSASPPSAASWMWMPPRRHRDQPGPPAPWPPSRAAPR